MIALSQGNVVLELLPEIGGAVGRLLYQGRDVLRPAPHDAVQPLETASFALVPFANRVAQGRFVFEGREIVLPPNLDGEPHALHGQGWLAPWSVHARDEARIVLAYEHAPGAWPWAYAAEQTFALTPRGVLAVMSLRNLTRRPMPVSLGFHPYFLASAATKLTVSLSEAWLSDETCIPARKVRACELFDASKGAMPADAPHLDHCFTGFGGTVVVDQPEQGLRIAMTASDALGLLHLYVPRGEPFFCAEPVSAMPDAFNRRDEAGFQILAPGEVTMVWMELAASVR